MTDKEKADLLLDAVRDITLCGVGPIAENARATHCPKGHEYTHENTSLRKNGHRDCRACKKETDKIWHKKRWERIKEWEALKDENAALRKVVDAARGCLWIDECHCDLAYTLRGRHAPNKRCGELDPIREALRKLDEEPSDE